MGIPQTMEASLFSDGSTRRPLGMSHTKWSLVLACTQVVRVPFIHSQLLGNFSRWTSARQLPIRLVALEEKYAHQKGPCREEMQGRGST